MKLVDFNLELICGLGLEIEYSKGEWIGYDNNYLLVDFLCFRFMFVFAE